MIDKIKALVVKYRQFLLFCIVGASNTLITLGVSYVLNKVLNIDPIVASIPAYAAGIVNGYIWSTLYVFRAKKTAGNLTKFIVVNAAMIALNLLLVALYTKLFNISGFLSQVLATPFTLVGNYLLNKFWTFSEKNKKSEQ